jgi:hypothetical protein
MQLLDFPCTHYFGVGKLQTRKVAVPAGTKATIESTVSHFGRLGLPHVQKLAFPTEHTSHQHMKMKQ